jgi:hypothetical protein
MMKQAVGLLASVAGIGTVALFIGVLVRLSWNPKTVYPVPTPDKPGSPKTE